MRQERISVIKIAFFFVLIINNSNCFNLKNLFASLSTQFSSQKENNQINKQSEQPEPNQLHKKIVFLQNKEMPSLVQKNQNSFQFGFGQNDNEEGKKSSGDPKIKNILFAIETLEGVKEKSVLLIGDGKKRMDKDYNQCIKSVQNFNCSYASEWNYLKRKHLKNITIMKQEIDAQEQAITEIKMLQQQQNQEKHQIISQIYPQILQLTNDIQKVDGMIKYLENGFLSKPNDDKSQENKAQEPNKITQTKEEQKPAAEKQTQADQQAPTEQNDQKAPTEDKTQKAPTEEKAQTEEKAPTKDKAQTEEKAPTEEKAQTEEKAKTEDNKQQESQQTEQKTEETNKNEQQQGETKQGRIQTVSERDESAFEKFKENFFPKTSEEQKQNKVISDKKLFAKKQSPKHFSEQEDETIYDMIEDSDNLFDSFVETNIDYFRRPLQIHSSNLLKDSDDILSANLILEEEGVYQDQKAGRNELQILIQQLQETVKIPENSNIKENKAAVEKQSEVLTKQMIVKLNGLLAAMKKEKIEKEKEIVVLEQVNHNEFIVHQDKVAKIQLNIVKIQAEVLAKEDWISQLQSKLMDCENQDLMRENCINSKDEDLRYIQQLNEMKAIAEGSIEQLKILMEYSGVPVITQNEEEKLEKKVEENKQQQAKQTEEQQKSEQQQKDEPQQQEQQQQTEQQQQQKQTQQKDEQQQKETQQKDEQTQQEPKVENSEENQANDQRKKESIFELQLAQLAKQNRNFPKKKKINNQEYILIPASDYEKQFRKQKNINLIKNKMSEMSLKQQKNKFKQNNNKQKISRNQRNKWY